MVVRLSVSLSQPEISIILPAISGTPEGLTRSCRYPSGQFDLWVGSPKLPVETEIASL